MFMVYKFSVFHSVSYLIYYLMWGHHYSHESEVSSRVWCRFRCLRRRAPFGVPPQTFITFKWIKFCDKLVFHRILKFRFDAWQEILDRSWSYEKETVMQNSIKMYAKDFNLNKKLLLTMAKSCNFLRLS